MRMSREEARDRDWWFGVLGGLVFAVVMGLGTQAYQENRETRDREALGIGGTDDVPAPVDMVRDLLDQEGQIVVHPELVDRIKPEQLERAREILAAAPSEPARHIAYAPRPAELDTGYTNTGALGQWMHSIGEAGHYVMIFDDGSTQVEAIGMRGEYLSDGAKGQPGPALVRVAQQVAEWGSEPERATTAGSDDWGGPFGGMMAGLLIGAFTIVPLFFLLRWSVGRRRYKES